MVIVDCYGASLTEGWSVDDGGAVTFEPYSRFMDARKFTCRNCGISGETTAQVWQRMRSRYDGDEPRGGLSPNVQYVAVLAGTNDVASGVHAHAVRAADNIQVMCDWIDMNKAVPVLITIPAVGVSVHAEWPDATSVRLVLNDRLRSLAAARGYPLVDLFDVTSESWSMADGVPTGQSRSTAARRVLQRRFDADGLHLKSEGYELLAKLVSDAIVSHRTNGSLPLPALMATGKVESSTPSNL